MIATLLILLASGYLSYISAVTLGAGIMGGVIIAIIVVLFVGMVLITVE